MRPNLLPYGSPALAFYAAATTWLFAAPITALLLFASRMPWPAEHAADQHLEQTFTAPEAFDF